jgi:hypothetical protein
LQQLFFTWHIQYLGGNFENVGLATFRLLFLRFYLPVALSGLVDRLFMDQVEILLQQKITILWTNN